MQKLSRREALRGTGVAALAAGVAVVPLVAVAMPARDPHERIQQAMREIKTVMRELHPGGEVHCEYNEEHRFAVNVERFRPRGVRS